MNLLKILIKKMLVIAILLMFLTFFVEDKVGYLQGVVGGLLYSILNFRFLAFTTNKVMRMTKIKAMIFTTTSYLLRYLLLGLILTATVLYSKSMLLGTVLGLFALKISIHLLSKEELDGKS
jgi:hypothetical protein